MNGEKTSFKGIIMSAQPRIRLTRSFDERSHNYLGYSLVIKGFVDDDERDFSLGIGKASQQKDQYCCGDEITGDCVPVVDQNMETVDFYKASKLKKINSTVAYVDSPPWCTTPPELDVYRERGHRRLAAQTYTMKCVACIWGCRMPVEIIVDNWKQDVRQYRVETFCYGPLSCKFYKPGPTRKVKGRNGMVYEEEDWVDEEETRHRDADE